MASNAMPLSKYVDLTGYTATYKDCQIKDMSQISPDYWLIELQLPPPYGGTLQELIHKDTILKVKGGSE